ncbi:hypothetical protein [Desulforhopalus sp. 52FAK]
MKNLRKLIAKLLIPFIVLVHFPFPVFAAPTDEELTLQIEQSAVKKAKAGETIQVTANISIAEGIEIVRIYFRAVGSTPYYFVPMIASSKSKYYSILPAPDGTASEIEYLFLVKTYNNRVFTSTTSTVTVTGQKDLSADPKQDVVDVSVETTKVPGKIVGFSEETKVRLVTQSEKHGVLAGLYDRRETGGTSSSGHYHGTIEASESSNLNTWLIGGGVAAGAAVIAVVAGSSGSGSSSSSSGTSTTASTGAGSWTLQFEYSPCSRVTSQTVACSTEGLVTSVSPTAIGIPLPESCSNSPDGGLANIFVVGGSCDTVTACNNYSSSDLTSKTCADKSIILYKNDSLRIERWSVQ